MLVLSQHLLILIQKPYTGPCSSRCSAPTTLTPPPFCFRLSGRPPTRWIRSHSRCRGRTVRSSANALAISGTIASKLHLAIWQLMNRNLKEDSFAHLPGGVLFMLYLTSQFEESLLCR